MWIYLDASTVIVQVGVSIGMLVESDICEGNTTDQLIVPIDRINHKDVELRVCVRIYVVLLSGWLIQSAFHSNRL